MVCGAGLVTSGQVLRGVVFALAEAPHWLACDGSFTLDDATGPACLGVQQQLRGHQTVMVHTAPLAAAAS
jgi:hypothetical protein